MGQLAKTRGFDYGQIEDKDVRGKLTYFAGTIKKKKIAGTSLMLEIGADLMGAQEVMANQKNGVFQSWLELECDYSKTTAYRIIGAARVFGHIITSQIGTLSDSAMYLLAADNCPPPATEEALKLSKQGKSVTHKLAKQLISKYTVPAASSAYSPPAPGSPQVANPPQAPQPAITEAIEEEKKPEPWEEFAAEHEDALKHLTAAISCMNRIEKRGEEAAYLAPVITRIRTDYKALRGTIVSNCPVGMKGGEIQTKVMERK